METKLESMAGFEAVMNNLDGLELINLLRKAHFKQDGKKQAMLEIVEADKRLMLCWQKPGMLIDAYTRDFKAKVGMYKTVGSAIDISDATEKLVCSAAGEKCNSLVLINSANNMTALAKIHQLGRD